MTNYNSPKSETLHRIPKLYVLLSFFFCLVLLGLISSYGRNDLHMLTMDWHTYGRDVFFKWATYLGEIFVPLAIFGWIVWNNGRNDVFLFLAAFLIQWALVQGIKQLFFEDGIRPVLYFERRGIELPLVQGVSVGITRTFPSGHSAMGFFAFFVLAQLLRQWYWQIVCFGLAVLAAISRVYLWKHFVLDIVGGILIGGMAIPLVQQWIMPLFVRRNPVRF